MLPLLTLAISLSFPPQVAPLPQEPREIVRAAQRALQDDRVGELRAQWDASLARDSSDRAAAFGLATLARMTYEYERADSLYQRLLDTAEEGTPDGYAAWAWLGYGMGWQWRGQLRPADEAYARAVEAARLAGEEAAHFEAAIRWAGVRARARGIAEARALVADLEVPAGEPGLQALDLCARQPLLGNGGAIEDGLELARAAGDYWLESLCLLNLAQGASRRGRVDSALYLLGLADEVQVRARDRVGRAATLQRAGWMLGTVRAYGRARRKLYEAIAEGERSRNLSPVAWAYLNLVDLSMAAGDLGSAERYARRGAEMMEAQGDSWGSISIRARRARVAAALGRVEEARTLYREALAGYEAGEDYSGVVYVRGGLAVLAASEGDWDEVERELEAARATALERGMPGWARGLDYDFAVLAMARGDLDEAEQLVDRMLAERTPPLQNYRNLVIRAELRARRGAIDAAIDDLVRANDKLDDWRDGLDRNGLRRYAFQISANEYDPDLGVASIIAAIAADGRAATAFQLAERQRARDLLDQLVRATALGAGSGGAELDLESLRGARVALDPGALAAALPDDRTALFEYVTGLGGEPTTLFVVTKAGLRSYELPSIDSLAAEIRRFVTLAGSGAETTMPGRRLGLTLLGPALADLPEDTRHWIFVADGLLHRVPFDALRLGDGRYVIESNAVSLVPSAAVAMELWARDRHVRGSSMLVLADPRFEDGGVGGGVAESFRAAFEETGGLEPLPGSRREARSVARFADDALVRLGDRASEAFVKRADLSGYRVIHFATHALVDDDAITRTALALSGGEGEDGFLEPADLAVLKLDADLVVLSACRTAGGVVLRGEGVYGLTAPLIEAGARSVVATKWPIGDRESARFVESFYGQLARGLGAADALRAAKLEALERGAPVARWAAFTLVGDPFVDVPLELPKGWPASVWLALVVAAAGAAYAVRAVRARRRIRARS